MTQRRKILPKKIGQFATKFQNLTLLVCLRGCYTPKNGLNMVESNQIDHTSTKKENMKFDSWSIEHTKCHWWPQFQSDKSFRNTLW